MIAPLRDLPIKTKLILMMMIISCTVIVLVTIVHDLLKAHQSREDMLSELSVMASVVAFNGRAAVAFNDAEAATQTLHALQFEPAILYAVLIDNSAQSLAEFRRSDQQQGTTWQSFGIHLGWPKQPGLTTQQRLRDNYFFFYQPVVINGELVGKLFLKSELSSLRERYLIMGLVSFGSLLVAAFVAYLLALRLQRWISEPLQDLAGAMAQVSGEKTLNIRLAGQGHDEIGMLLDGFNGMLERIEEHERQLAEVNEGLERSVEQRTEELVLTNRRLTTEVNRRVYIEEQQRALLTEKELLLKEVHHRVKNNLQVISSLISMQMRKVSAEEGRDELFSVRERIRSMSLVHEQLCRSGDLSEVAFDCFAAEFIQQLSAVYGTRDRSIVIDENLSPVTLNVDQAVPCGMILSEILGNAFKHAFSMQSSGHVSVSLRQAENQVLLRIEDNGRGGVGDATQSLGLKLVYSLIEQLNGEITFTDVDGLRVDVSFPIRMIKMTADVDDVSGHEDAEGYLEHE